MFSFQIEVRLFYKYGVIYREVMHSPRHEWCGLYKYGNSNPLIAQMIKVVEENAPQIVHECPYTVRLKSDSAQLSYS